MGQNGDPDDCVRFGYLWGLNGGEVGLLALGRYLTPILYYSDYLPLMIYFNGGYI